MLERPADKQSDSQFQDRERACSPATAFQKKPANRPVKWSALKARATSELHAFFRRQECAPHECEGSALDQISDAIDRAILWASVNDDLQAKRIMSEIDRRDMQLPSRRLRYLWYDYAIDKYRP